jgi:hypothetical protein
MKHSFFIALHVKEYTYNFYRNAFDFIRDLSPLTIWENWMLNEIGLESNAIDFVD